jgi:chromosome segregation ATPase
MITEVAFSHDGSRYFTADWNGKIEVWNTLDFQKVGELTTTPPSIEERIISISENKKTIEAELILHQEKSTAADLALKAVLAKLKIPISTISILKRESTGFQQEVNALSKRLEELEQMIETKIQDRDQTAQNIKETIQQKIKTEQERSKLTAESQKLEQERIAADRTVMAASQDTLKKREASNRDPQNIGTKNLLIVAEQIEGLARQVVQRYAEKLADLDKLIVTHASSIENLNAEIPQLNARTEQLTTEHQQLIAQRNQATKDKEVKLAKIQGANTEILTIEKQLEVLNKTVQDQEKISAAEKEVVTKTMVKRSQLAGRLRKWKAASINTTLIKARSELAVLASLNKDDPSNESKIIAHQKKCDDLSLRYQAAKQ